MFVGSRSRWAALGIACLAVMGLGGGANAASATVTESGKRITVASEDAIALTAGGSAEAAVTNHGNDPVDVRVSAEVQIGKATVQLAVDPATQTLAPGSSLTVTVWSGS